MKRFLVALAFTGAIAFLSCVPTGCKTPPDRIAFASLQTSDASLDTAYHAWLASWKERRANGGNTPALLAERDRVASVLTKYQTAHRAALRAAETAIQSTNSVAVLALDNLSGLKAELLNALSH